MFVEEKLQCLIDLHTEIQHFLDLYNWGKEHDLNTELMQQSQPRIPGLQSVLQVLEKEIRDNNYLPREPDKEVSDIEQLLLFIRNEVIEDAGELHSKHLQESRGKIDELAAQCTKHDYSATAEQAIKKCSQL